MTPTVRSRIIPLVPGVALCAVLAAFAAGVQILEARAFGRAVFEALVLAILIGAVVRTVAPGIGAKDGRYAAGIRWSGATLLEIAVALLGASLDGAVLMSAGMPIISAVVIAVCFALLVSYAIGRALGLGRRLAVLVACGNAICGNSAIAAVATVIGAESEDVASSIAFTAVLGVVVVLLLPTLIGVFGLSHFQYGVLAGMTVYAVPQVLAATFPVSALSGQIGTFVKLIRVLMLGPIVVGLSVRNHGRGVLARVGLHRLIPWFILAFLLLAGLRSAGVISPALGTQLHSLAGGAATVSMAALGLGVDARALARAGARVTATVTLSLAALILASLALIFGLGIGR